jgi:hypothetical protein
VKYTKFYMTANQKVAEIPLAEKTSITYDAMKDEEV